MLYGNQCSGEKTAHRLTFKFFMLLWDLWFYSLGTARVKDIVQSAQPGFIHTTRFYLSYIKCCHIKFHLDKALRIWKLFNRLLSFQRLLLSKGQMMFLVLDHRRFTYQWNSFSIFYFCFIVIGLYEQVSLWCWEGHYNPHLLDSNDRWATFIKIMVCTVRICLCIGNRTIRCLREWLYFSDDLLLCNCG